MKIRIMLCIILLCGCSASRQMSEKIVTSSAEVSNTSATSTEITEPSDERIRQIVSEVFPERSYGEVLRQAEMQGLQDITEERINRLLKDMEQVRERLFEDVKNGRTYSYYGGGAETVDCFTYLESLLSEYPVMTDEQEQAYVNDLKELRKKNLDSDASWIACYYKNAGREDKEILVIIPEDKKKYFTSDEWTSLEQYSITCVSDSRYDLIEKNKEEYCIGYARADEILKNVKQNDLHVVAYVHTRQDEKFDDIRWYLGDLIVTWPERGVLVTVAEGGLTLLDFDGNKELRLNDVDF